jgi:hypothetical protein
MRIIGREPKPEPRIVKTYDYTDESSTILFQKVRYDPKDFKQRRPDGKGGWIWNLKGVRHELYRLAEVIAATIVLIVEGEKDADAAAALGFAATTNPGGAGKWRDEYSETIRGKTVVIVPDLDEVGRKHADQVAQSLRSVAASVKILALPFSPEHPGKDLSDWIAAGGTKEQLQTLIDAASEPRSGDGDAKPDESPDAEEDAEPSARGQAIDPPRKLMQRP